MTEMVLADGVHFSAKVSASEEALCFPLADWVVTSSGRRLGACQVLLGVARLGGLPWPIDAAKLPEAISAELGAKVRARGMSPRVLDEWHRLVSKARSKEWEDE